MRLLAVVLFSTLPVLSAEPEALASSIQFDVRRESARRPFFTRLKEDFVRDETQQGGPSGTFLKNYPLNQISIESGWRFTRGPSMRQRPWHGWLTSVNGASQFQSPFQNITVKLPTGSLSFHERSARSSRLLGKFGYRWEGRESWLESGVFLGSVSRPGALSLLSDGFAVTCNASSDLIVVGRAVQTLANCLGAKLAMQPAIPTAPITLRTQAFRGREAGFFFNTNIRWTQPRATGLDQLVVENRGRWYFHSPGISS